MKKARETEIDRDRERVSERKRLGLKEKISGDVFVPS